MKFLTACLVALPVLATARSSQLRWGRYTNNTLDLSDVQARGLTYGGSGCKQGSNPVLSADKFTILFEPNMTARIGPNVKVDENRKNCQINFDLTYPEGLQYALYKADYYGYASLESGITGQLKTTVYFSGQSNQGSGQYTLQGPMTSTVDAGFAMDWSHLLWSPCGSEGALNLNSQVRVTSTNKSASGLIALGSRTMNTTNSYHLAWRQCGDSETIFTKQ